MVPSTTLWHTALRNQRPLLCGIGGYLLGMFTLFLAWNDAMVTKVVVRSPVHRIPAGYNVSDHRKYRHISFAKDFAPDQYYEIDVESVASEARPGNAPKALFKHFGAVVESNVNASTSKHASIGTTTTSTTCFVPGTDVEATEKARQGGCLCKNGYFGSHCSIPESVNGVTGNERLKYAILNTPRRIVMGLVVNHELELTEIRVRQLAPVVDVFIVGESNITANGDPKPLYFLEAFKSGFLFEFHYKILYVFQDHFPPGSIENGWKADEFIRTHMSQKGLSRIRGLRDDDLFINCDADEIPKAEVLTFLKLHSGFTDPIRFNYRWSLYGYFYTWAQDNVRKLYSRVAGSTIGFLRDICKSDAILLRRKHTSCIGFNAAKHRLFSIGIFGDYAGHHCSWCFDAEGIRMKLVSAQRADGPRWGNYRDKTELGYIRGLVRTGTWFDGKHVTRKASEETEPDLAPQYVLANREKYAHLLIRPSLNGTNS